MEILTLIAIVVSPIIPVYIGIWLQDRRFNKERKMLILRCLMMNRGQRLHSDFVGALNLIEIEFYKSKKIKKAWEELLGAYSTETNDKNFLSNIDNKLAELIKLIAEEVGYNVDKLELLKNAYFPRGWENDSILFRKKDELILELLENKRSLSIQSLSLRNNKSTKKK